MKYFAYYIIIAVALFLSAFFSSAEIAYTSLNRVRLEHMAEQGSKRAKCALKIRESYDATICSILICNDLVNILISSVATTFALVLMTMEIITEAQASTFPTLITTVVVLVFCDIVPKILAKQHALSYALLIAYPLRAVTWLLYPVSHPVALLLDRMKKRAGEEETPLLTEDELSAIFETAEEEGVVDEDKGDLLQSAMDYQETTVEQILLPRINLIGLDIGEEPEQIRDLCYSTNYSRLPVYRESLDHIIGILTVNHYLKAAAEHPGQTPCIEELMNEPYFVHQTAKLPKVLHEMRARQNHMAIVMDEYGGTMGIVTMEDILEEIVGDIWDESDTTESDDIVTLGEGEYDVDGMTPIADFFESAEIDDRGFESEYTTMGGWAVEMLEENPHPGDSFTWRNLTVTVKEMNDNLVGRLHVSVAPQEEDDQP